MQAHPLSGLGRYLGCILRPRFASRILAILQRAGRDRGVIDRPHLDDADENTYRALVLGEHRGYRHNADVFTGMPDDMRWFRARLTREELTQVRYIDYDYWTELSGGTGRVADGGFWYLADAQRGGATFPEPIWSGQTSGRRSSCWRVTCA